MPNWKMEARAGVELVAAPGAVPPKRRDCDAGVTVVLLVVLAAVFNPKPNTGCEAGAVVLAAAVEVAVASPVKRGAVVAAVVAGAVVSFGEKGDDMGMDDSGPKMGLKAGAVGVRVLDEATVVPKELAGKELSLSLLGVAIKMGLNIGEALAGPGAVREEVLAGGLLSIPNSRLGFGVGEGAGGAGIVADGSACGAADDLVSGRGSEEEAGVSPWKEAMGLESEEVPG